MRIVVVVPPTQRAVAQVNQVASFFPGHEIHVATSAEEQDQWIGQADVLMSNAFVPVGEDALRRAKELRVIQVLGVGVDHVDLGAAAARGIVVADVAGANCASVAEHVVMSLLCLYRPVVRVDAALREGGWPLAAWLEKAEDLAGKTVGIVGMGRIGREVARRLVTFDVGLLYYDLVRLPDDLEAELGVSFAEKPDILAVSDAITLHLPHTPATRHFLAREEFALMPKGSVLVNAARAELVNLEDLAQALRSHLRGAALDVFSQRAARKGRPASRAGERPSDAARRGDDAAGAGPHRPAGAAEPPALFGRPSPGRRGGALVNAREAFHAWMKAHGIEHVFGNPGSTEIPALVGWPDGVRYVLGLQESVVVATADAYAQARGRCALVSLHAAQGLGNAIGALRTAARNRAPMVVLVGQEDARHQVLAPLLYGDMVSLAQPVVKWAYEVEDSADLVAALERAWHLAGTTPAGPVMLSVPANLWDGPATPTAARARRAAQAVDEGALGEVMAAMASSRAPALVMGSGVARADAFGVAVALAQRLQCPVYGAPLAERIGFPNRHSLYEGTLPPALPLILQTLSRHDAVFVFGAPAFLCYPYLPGPRTLPMPVYHVDDDPEHLAASLAQRTYLHALGPALASLSAIAPQAEARAGATAARAARRRSDAVRARARMGVPYVLDDIARTVPSGTTVIDEAVSSSPLVREYLPVEGPRQYFTAATGGLGWGIGAAAGAALASPGRKVLALVGDGASLYGVQGLWTLGRFGLPVGVVVLDNGLYSILQSFGRMLYPGREDTMPGLELQGIDLVRIAEGLAVPAWRIEDAPALEERLTDLWQRPGPFLLDVAVAPQPVSLA